MLPARSRKPRDKAKAEDGVQVAERWILAVLRNRLCFSLGQLNTAIGPVAGWPQSEALEEATRLTPVGLRNHRSARAVIAVKHGYSVRYLRLMVELGLVHSDGCFATLIADCGLRVTPRSAY